MIGIYVCEIIESWGISEAWFPTDLRPIPCNLLTTEGVCLVTGCPDIARQWRNKCVFPALPRT